MSSKWTSQETWTWLKCQFEAIKNDKEIPSNINQILESLIISKKKGQIASKKTNTKSKWAKLTLDEVVDEIIEIAKEADDPNNDVLERDFLEASVQKLGLWSVPCSTRSKRTRDERDDRLNDESEPVNDSLGPGEAEDEGEPAAKRLKFSESQAAPPPPSLPPHPVEPAKPLPNIFVPFKAEISSHHLIVESYFLPSKATNVKLDFAEGKKLLFVKFAIPYTIDDLYSVAGKHLPRRDGEVEADFDDAPGSNYRTYEVQLHWPTHATRMKPPASVRNGVLVVQFEKIHSRGVEPVPLEGDTEPIDATNKEDNLQGSEQA